MDSVLENNRYEILTDDGFKNFYGLFESTSSTNIKLYTDNSSILCTEDHEIFYPDLSHRPAKYVQIGDVVYGGKIITNIEYVSTEISVFDILEVEDIHRFLCDSFLVKNCVFMDEFAHVHNNLAEEFFTSTYPVISSGKSTKIIIVSCVTKDTYIFSDKGIKQVSDFIDVNKLANPNLGYEIENYNIFGMNKLNSGNIMVNSGKVPTKIITSKSTNIECSLEHKLWACKSGNFGWYKAKDLTTEDYISIRYGDDIWGNNDDISDYIPYETNKFSNDLLIPDKLTKEWGYFLGLYLAEGYTDIKTNRTIITCGDDILDSLKFLGLPINNQDKIHYVMSSIKLSHFLTYLGFDLTKKAKEKVIPKRILECSREVICAFLSGFFDGDGSATSRGKISVISSSKELINQLRILLLNLGITSQYYTGITPPTKKVKVSSVYHKLEINSYNECVFFYNTIGFKLNRKQARYNLLQSPNRKVTKDCIPYGKEFLMAHNLKKYNKNELTNSLHVSREFSLNINGVEQYPEIFNKNIKWEKITSISNSENEVYDFSLNHIDSDPWCHSVIYNGIIGHQTPRGLNLYYRMWMDAISKKSDYFPVDIHWSRVPGRDETWKEMTIRNTSARQFSQEFECVSKETLIDIDGKLLPIGDVYENILEDA